MRAAMRAQHASAVRGFILACRCDAGEIESAAESLRPQALRRISFMSSSGVTTPCNGSSASRALQRAKPSPKPGDQAVPTTRRMRHSINGRKTGFASNRSADEERRGASAMTAASETRAGFWGCDVKNPAQLALQRRNKAYRQRNQSRSA